MTDSSALAEPDDEAIDWLALSDDELFEIIVSPEISGLIVDFTRDEIVQVVQVAQAQGKAPGDFIRHVVLRATAAALNETAAVDQNLQVAD